MTSLYFKKIIVCSTPNRLDSPQWKLHHDYDDVATAVRTWKDEYRFTDQWKIDTIKKIGYKVFLREYECTIHTMNELYNIIDDLSGS